MVATQKRALNICAGNANDPNGENTQHFGGDLPSNAHIVVADHNYYIV
jgi:hypothetical protein